MRLSTVVSTIAVTASTAVAGSVPACSSESSTPCSCPNGTDYQQSVTFAVIGAAAMDVKAVIADFFNTAWLGVTPFATRGPENSPGVSIRTSHLPTAVGTYNISEQLFELKANQDGSFVQGFEQLPSSIPIEYQSGNGSFSGYYVTLESNAVFQFETAIRWSVYGCLTGHPIDFADFHESALANATSILQAQGKIRGTTVKAFSVQDF